MHDWTVSSMFETKYDLGVFNVKHHCMVLACLYPGECLEAELHAVLPLCC
jgi:hypothetical protein